MKLFGPFSLAIASTLAAGRVHKHDSSFNPNFVLSVTQQNISIGGMYRESVLVNNSLPGPTLRIQENEVVWIRVYNNMAHQNLTMVRAPLQRRFFSLLLFREDKKTRNNQSTLP